MINGPVDFGVSHYSYAFKQNLLCEIYFKILSSHYNKTFDMSMIYLIIECFGICHIYEVSLSFFVYYKKMSHC